MHSNRVIRQLSEVVYEQSPESPVPPAPHSSNSPSNSLREQPSNVIVANNSGLANKDELERPATLALIGSGGAQQSQLHSTNSAFHYSAASPYASSPYSEPSTPASSLTSSNFLHVPNYANAYTGISPTLEFGMFWNAPWPFGAAASHSLAASATTAIGQSEMISTSDLPSSLAEVAAASQYHTQGQFLSPVNCNSTASNQFSTNCRVQQHLQTAAASLPLNSPVTSNSITQMTRSQSMRTTPASTRRGVDGLGRWKMITIRNKEAAARCRKRRLDQMATLQKQVDELKEGSRQQQVLIEQLTMEKDHIENILHQHSNCKLPSKNHDNNNQQQHNNNSSHAAMLGYPSNSMMQQRLGVQQQHSMISSFKRNSSPALTEQCLNSSGMVQQQQQQHNQIEYFKEELMMDSSPSSQYTNTNSHSMIMDNDNDPVISDAAVGKKNRCKQDGRGLRECSEMSGDQYDAYGNHDGHERPKTLFDNATMRGNPAFDSNVISTPSNGLLDTPCYPAFLLESRTGLTPMTNNPMPITNGPMHVSSNMPPHNGDLRDL
uniref:BZIP domain-containing protein n=1 Tax=Ditylenchus dipsaci TaxID=166011 RepID=A0A915DR39_9BILA